MNSEPLAIFGLGEAGGAISAGLVAAGIRVNGYDPAAVPTPPGVIRHADPVTGVGNCRIIMAITSAADAERALEQALDVLTPGALYADFSTASPGLKQRLAHTADQQGLKFADVAIMAPVPGKGIHVPVSVSGPGAESFEQYFTALGMQVERVPGNAGAAAMRKLLRSVMMKGLAAVLIEAQRAGHAAGLGDWLWKNMSQQLAVADEFLVARLVKGTKSHALRRLHEMQAAEALLDELEVDTVMTRATVESLRRMLQGELPDIPRS